MERTDTFPVDLKGLSPEENLQIVPKTTILLGYRGSIAHGTYVPNTSEDSVDDKDIMSVFIPPIESYFGLHSADHHEKFIREWDSVSYEIRKFFRLLVKSNPNVLSLLWIEPRHYIRVTEWGRRIIKNRDLFSSKTIYHSFTGYAYGQLKKMESGACRGYMGDKRRKLVEKHGYDTKNAAHCIRLLRMGIEFLNEGILHVQREDAPNLLEIKAGAWTIDQVKSEAQRLMRRAEQAYDNSRLPNRPKTREANLLLVDILRHFFGDMGR